MFLKFSLKRYYVGITIINALEVKIYGFMVSNLVLNIKFQETCEFDDFFSTKNITFTIWVLQNPRLNIYNLL